LLITEKTNLLGTGDHFVNNIGERETTTCPLFNL